MNATPRLRKRIRLDPLAVLATQAALDAWRRRFGPSPHTQANLETCVLGARPASEERIAQLGRRLGATPEETPNRRLLWEAEFPHPDGSLPRLLLVMDRSTELIMVIRILCLEDETGRN